LTAVIFDMDGVLIDSQPLHYEIDIRVISACGLTVGIDTVTPFTGISNPDRWPKYKDILRLEPTIARLIEMSEQAMRDVFNETELTAIKGIPELLQGLKGLGIPTGVASSSSHELIHMVLNRVGISNYFDHLISGEDVKLGKPAPDIYLRAAEVIGLAPGDCVAVEDAASGVLAAKNAGLTCICYKNPNTFGQVFDNADFVVEKYDECLPIIRKLMEQNL